MEDLVSTGWLAERIGAGDVRVVDASYHPLDPARDPQAEFAAAHIPGAAFLDLAGLGPATADLFAQRVAALGLTKADEIVLYDGAAHQTAARAWWLFRLFGWANLAILDGGFARWRAEGRITAAGPAAFSPVPTESLSPDPARMRTKAQVARGGELIVDARGAARFSGREADPRPGVAPGHIPGSVNLPYDRLIAADGTWKRGDDLRAAFAEAGVDPTRPFVTSCGSGVTAAVLLFGAHLLGQDDVALYDGSWREWGSDPDTPKAVS